MSESAIFGFEHAPMGLAVTRYRMIETCNARMAEIFDYNSEDLIGTSLAKLFPSTQEFVDVGTIGMQRMDENLRYEDERIMMRRTGEHFWCRVSGQSKTPDDYYAHCVWSFHDISQHRPALELSCRERQIAMLIIEGLTSKEIARLLNISPRTIDAHRARMMKKLNARNSAELIARLSAIAA